jgi:hypothetical protein
MPDNRRKRENIGRTIIPSSGPSRSLLPANSKTTPCLSPGKGNSWLKPNEEGEHSKRFFLMARAVRSRGMRKNVSIRGTFLKLRPGFGPAKERSTRHDATNDDKGPKIIDSADFICKVECGASNPSKRRSVSMGKRK